MSKTQTKTINYLKSKGYLALNVIKLGINGYPDVMAMKKGFPNIWIEIKEEKDTLKPLQQSKIDELNFFGNVAFCYHATKGIIYPKTYSAFTLDEILTLKIL